MAFFRRYTWTVVILSGLVLLLSCLTSFVGIFSNFTGTGDESLGSLGMSMASYSMTAALPVSLVVGVFSRRALVWVYLSLYLLTGAGVYILETANSSALYEPLRLATPSPLWSVKRALGAFGSIAVLYLVLAVLTEFLFCVERYKEKTLDETASDTI